MFWNRSTSSYRRRLIRSSSCDSDRKDITYILADAIENALNALQVKYIHCGCRAARLYAMSIVDRATRFGSKSQSPAIGHFRAT